MAHERRVIIRIRELLLKLGLPGHLDDVDTHAVADDKHRKVADVRRFGEVRRRLSDRPTAPRAGRKAALDTSVGFTAEALKYARDTFEYWMLMLVAC